MIKEIMKETLSRDKQDLAGGFKWVRPTTKRHISKDELLEHFIEGKEIDPDDLEDPDTPSPIMPRTKIELAKTTTPKKEVIPESEKLNFNDADSSELDLNDFAKIDELMSQMTES